MAAGSGVVRDGEAAFVDELRKVDDADALGAFAARWLADTRPEARRLLLDYLDRPLNAFRHEALVKRLFKLAEAAGDDELMARFLVAFDRSVRRVLGRRHHFESHPVESEQEANELAAAWRDQGFESTGVYQNWRKQYHVWGRWSESIAKAAHKSTMPRGTLPPKGREALKKRRLFSMTTRHYLRRCAWRYFRKLGRASRNAMFRPSRGARVVSR